MTTTTTHAAASLRVGDFRIRPDPHGAGWILAELRTHGPTSKHAGQEYEADVRYPSSFATALRSVLDRMAMSELPPEATLAEAVATVERLYATIGEVSAAYTERR